MKRYTIKLRVIILSLVVFGSIGITALPATTLAAPASSTVPSKCVESVTFLKFPTWYKYIIDPASSGTKCELKFDPTTDIPKVLLAVFEIILRIGGMLAVGMVIYGGILYIISQGEPDKTKGARTTILNAIIGLVITMSAVAIVNVIGKNI
jgi:hypothetical protein